MRRSSSWTTRGQLSCSLTKGRHSECFQLSFSWTATRRNQKKNKKFNNGAEREAREALSLASLCRRVRASRRGTSGGRACVEGETRQEATTQQNVLAARIKPTQQRLSRFTQLAVKPNSHRGSANFYFFLVCCSTVEGGLSNMRKSVEF